MCCYNTYTWRITKGGPLNRKKVIREEGSELQKGKKNKELENESN